MNKFYSNLLFSIAVTAVMNALDMMYHLATGWAVHLNYVAIKLTVIFLSVWMITQFIGKGTEEGIVTSIFGPFIFYIYYLFAGATLNRDVFKIDEQFWFFFLHLALMLIAYFSAWNFVKAKSSITRTSGFIITAVFFALALDALLIMIRLRFQGLGEEETASLFTFSVILVPLLSYLVGVILGILADKLTKKRYFDILTAAVVSSALLGALTRDIAHAAFAFVFVCIAYYAIHTYKKGLASEA